MRNSYDHLGGRSLTGTSWIGNSYHSTRYPSPTSVDPRLSFFPPDLFKGKRVLDIGCNEGWLTVDIAQRLGPARVIGVDLDPDLVRAAWKRRRLIWSLQRPATQPKSDRDVSLPLSETEHTGDSKRQKKRKRMDSQADLLDESVDASSTYADTSTYFPLSLEHMFGPIPIPPASKPASHTPATFPHNITFYAADWTKESMADNDEGASGGIEKEDKEGYDAVLAFSITKWIHLNGGDRGIISFFRKIYAVLKAGGLLLLDPQDWEGYAKARKMSPALAETYKGLQLRPSEFPRLLKEIGFVEAKVLATGGDDIYKRSVSSYRKL